MCTTTECIQAFHIIWVNFIYNMLGSIFVGYCYQSDFAWPTEAGVSGTSF
jgi:hypothetical protein